MMHMSRAAGVAISATALVALLAPAASAGHTYQKGELRVCVNGLDHGDEADVEVVGKKTDRESEFRGCHTFRLPSGWYEVSVDPPGGYEVEGDDDEWVRVDRGWRKTIRFWVTDDEYGDGYGGSSWDDRPKFVKRGPGERCPEGYRPSDVAYDICVRTY
jgi:hypothetical protein